jgi:hypothetical protein
MRRTLFGLAASGVLLLAGIVSAAAQRTTPPAPGAPGPPAFEQRANQPTGRPLFSIFGLPVGVNAPVAAPYCSGCAFENVGGQPGRSRDSVARAVSGPSQ